MLGAILYGGNVVLEFLAEVRGLIIIKLESIAISHFYSLPPVFGILEDFNDVRTSVNHLEKPLQRENISPVDQLTNPSISAKIPLTPGTPPSWYLLEGCSS